MRTKEKIEEIQYLRSVAFLAVVVQHAIGHYSYVPEVKLQDGVALGVLLLSVKFAVPLFIFISGLVLFYNYFDRFHYPDFLRKRARDILAPYLVWTVVYLLLFNSGNPGFWGEVKKLALLMFTGKASYHLWYVVMIIQFYLLFPVYRYLLAKWKDWLRSNRAAILSMIGLSAVYVYLTGQVWSIVSFMEGLNIPFLTPLFTTYADRNSLYFFYYFVLGGVAGLHMQAWRESIIKYRVFISGFFAVVFVYFAYTVISRFQMTPAFKVNFDDTFLLQPRMAVFLIVSIPFVYLLSMKFSEKGNGLIKGVLNQIGEYSYGAYLVHALMLDVSVRLTDSVFHSLNVALRTLLASLVCVVFSVVVTILLSKIPFGHWAVGIHKKSKA